MLESNEKHFVCSIFEMVWLKWKTAYSFYAIIIVPLERLGMKIYLEILTRTVLCF